MLTLVVPIFNEENLLDELVKRTISSIESFTVEYEIVFVDDGSTDQSLDKLLSLQQKNFKIKVLSLSKNFGHQAALTAGLEYSSGDLVAMMDGDLQDPPELLASMFSKLTNEGYDIISGRKSGRKGKGGRTFLTFLFHFLFKNISNIENVENLGNFSMMRREAVEALLSMKEKVRYLPGLRSFIGFNQGHIDFVREERYEGSTKMSYQKLFMLAMDAIFGFSRFPIRLCLYLGTIGTVVFMIAGIYVLIAKIFRFAVIGWSSTLLSIYFLGSVQLVFLGIIGEYIYRIYKESQNRPIYIVKKFYAG